MTCPVLPGFIDFNPMELLILGALGVLLFGERLPEVGKSVGKQLSQLKKGFRGIQDQIQTAVNSAGSSTTDSSSHGYGGEVYFEDIEEREEATAPKFEPPPAPASAPAAGSPSVTAAPPAATDQPAAPAVPTPGAATASSAPITPAPAATGKPEVAHS